MLLAQLTEMYALCFRFGKLKTIVCCQIFDIVQISDKVHEAEIAT